MCRNELGEFYRWWIFVGVRKLTPTYRARVLEIYDELRTKDFPPYEAIGGAWAVYRTLQVQLLAAVEYVRRYGPGASEITAKRVENDVIDIEYCVMTCLADALASRNDGLIELFRVACPNGVIVS